MKPSLTYTPAYLGLYAALVLAVTSNAFLDIGYGLFGTEVVIWSAVFAFALWTGWRQQGAVTPRGRRLYKAMLTVAILASLLVLLPIWGLPRGAVYALAAVQAAYSCILTTRRQLYFGLLVSAVLVMFAASHYRADWTLLFYLVPYVIAVVFTLVAEQINRRVEDLNTHSLGRPLARGQGVAIVAAVSVILVVAGALYAATPQFTWRHLNWDYGVPAPAGPGGDAGEAGSGAGLSGSGTTGGYDLTPDAMREAAKRRGMPAWQAAMINGLADLVEGTGEVLVPVRDALRDLREAVRDWLRQHKADIVRALALLALLALLIALWRLLREARPGIWLRTRIDYLRFIVLGWHAPGAAGILQLYAATQRLFAWQELPRRPQCTAREYLTLLCQVRADLRPQLTELTQLFEQTRYGGTPATDAQLPRMRALYLHLFRNAD